jgi:D-tyrosyl-tRNA(Tyr) deacylase
VGVAEGDGTNDVSYLADKIVNLRIMEDEGGRMNRSVSETKDAVLVVSQFTLIAETRKGRRPSFAGAAAPKIAEPLVCDLTDLLHAAGVTVGGGEFGATMNVELINHGPVTIILDSRDRHVSRRSAKSTG